MEQNAGANGAVMGQDQNQLAISSQNGGDGDQHGV